MGAITYGCYHFEEGKQGKRQEKTNQKTPTFSGEFY